MHVHCKEGSPLDAKLSIFDVVGNLKTRGFDGMMITDHNSYGGYEAWLESERRDFIVIKAVEYSTLDAGHCLVVVPNNVDTKIFTVLGLRVKELINIVHGVGGIIGLAHPFYYGRLGLCNMRKWKNNLDICNEFDFIEGINSSNWMLQNKNAVSLAKYFNRPVTAGSDVHRTAALGTASTLFKTKLNNKSCTPEDDFIEMFKSTATNYSNTVNSISGYSYMPAVLKNSPKLVATGTQFVHIHDEIKSILSSFERHRLSDEIFDFINSLNIETNCTQIPLYAR